MNNVMKIVELGICVGCQACSCEYISFSKNKNGFPSPIVDEKCTQCGKCLTQCIYNPEDDN